MERKPGRPRALTVEQIAQAALDDGIDAFSMPSVARRLGVAHSGLYRYVADRDALLVTAVDRAVQTVTWPSADLPWEELLRAVGESLWDLCDRYPGIARASMNAPRAAPTSIALIETYVAQLHHEGFSPEDAAVAVNFLISLTFTSSADAARRRRNGHSTVAASSHEILKAYDSDEAVSDRGWYERKFDIMLAGLGPRRIS